MKAPQLIIPLALAAITLPAFGQTVQKFNDAVSSGGGRSSVVIGAETFHITACVGDLVAPPAPVGSLFVESGFIATLSSSLTADPADDSGIPDGIADSWEIRHGITTFVPTNDLDKDGLNDLLEAAFNLDPDDPDAAQAYQQSIVTEAGEKYLQLVFRRHKWHSAVSLQPLRGTGLDAPAWSTWGITEVSVDPIDTDTDEVTVRSDTPLSGAEKQFMKLRAIYTPPNP